MRRGSTIFERRKQKLLKDLHKKKTSSFYNIDDDDPDNENNNDSKWVDSPLEILDYDQFDYNAEELNRQGYDRIGTLQKGDFFGHLSLMNTNRLHKSYIIATSNCTVYELSRSDILKILTTEPTIAIQLQAALAQSIAAQSDLLGKEHMRERRARELLKYNRLYKKRRKAKDSGGIVGRNVSTRSSFRSVAKRSSFNNVYDYISNSSSHKDDGTTAGDIGGVGAGVVNTAAVVNKGVQNVVLTKAKALYNSDDDNDKQNNKILYNNNYNRESNDSEMYNNNNDNNAKIIDSKSVMIHRSHVPISYKYRTIYLKNLLTNLNRTNNTSSPIKSPRRNSFMKRIKTQKNPNNYNNHNEQSMHEPIRRTMSTSDIMMLDYVKNPYEVSLINNWSNGCYNGKSNKSVKNLLLDDDDHSSNKDDDHSNQYTQIGIDEEEETDDKVFIPIFPNMKALRSKHLIRRQSFPSIDNDIWKINNVSRGVC